MTPTELIHLAQPEVEASPRQLQAVEELVGSCPWFAYARLVLLKVMKQNSHPSFDTQLAYASLCVTDRCRLDRYLQRVKPGKQPAEPTDDVVAALLRLSDGFEVIDTDELTDTLPLLTDEAAVDGRGDICLIDKFIRESPRLSPIRPEPDEVDFSAPFGQIPDEAMSETLADIYLSQGLVDEAGQVYSKLSLLYPEKKAYFAALFADAQRSQRGKN